MRIAVIGDPIEHSMSALIYAHVFRVLGLDLHFEKIRISKLNLASNIKRLKGFDALLVTMPLKNEIVPFMSTLCDSAKLTNAVNFVLREGEDFHGFNTDGYGALESIEQYTLVSQKKILVLGAGGVASAICLEAKKRGADVSVYNRTNQRAKLLAKRLGVRSVKSLSLPYDIIVQATSVGLETRIAHPLINDTLLFSIKVFLEVNYTVPKIAYSRLSKLGVENVVLGDQMYYFMMKKQIKILLNKTLGDSIFYDKILKIFGDYNS